MNDTLSMPDPARQVAEVRQIIADRRLHTCEATLIRIRRVVDPPEDSPGAELDERGFPKLKPSDLPGTAWERHDEPNEP